MGEVAKILTQELPAGMRLPLDVVRNCIQPYFCGDSNTPALRETKRNCIGEIQEAMRHLKYQPSHYLTPTRIGRMKREHSECCERVKRDYGVTHPWFPLNYW